MEILKLPKWTKNKRYPVGYGYDKRTVTISKSILIHTTNGNKGSTFESEADYITNSRLISAHYLVGKQGQVVEFFDPSVYRAWHAGAVNDQRYNNNNSIGIENHYALGDVWTDVQRKSLSDLCKQLISVYGINSPLLIERHRQVAIPLGRKIDPSGFSDYEFELWRGGLFKYSIISESANVRNVPMIPSTIVKVLTRGSIIQGLEITDSKIFLGGTSKWIHTSDGYIHMSVVSSI